MARALAAQSDQVREREWEALYSALLDALRSFGNDKVLDAESDFFLVDDDWGGYHQKLCVISRKLWSDDVAKKISSVLATSELGRNRGV